MNALGRVFDAVRAWTGLAAGTQLTPGHGWLLPTVADARKQRSESDARRAALAARDARV